MKMCGLRGLFRVTGQDFMKYLNWFQLILGLWVFVSPWLLGFSDISTALWSNIIIGALIAIFALWEIFGNKPLVSAIQ